MVRYQITISDEQLHGLLQGDRGLGDLLEAVLNQVLQQAQATEYVKAEPYERTEERVGYRNGIRERPLTTRVGRLTLEVPQFRNGKLPIDMFERYQRSEQALIVTLMEMAVNGVSTRKITNITRELCGVEFSKSTVSDLLKGLDPVVREWIDRPIGTYPFLIVDAIVIKIRKGGRVRSRSVFMAAGVNPEGIREILGLWLADSEKETSWRDFFKWLKGRGVAGVDLVVSHDHGGLVNEVAVEFQGASWQRCRRISPRTFWMRVRKPFSTTCIRGCDSCSRRPTLVQQEYCWMRSQDIPERRVRHQADRSRVDGDRRNLVDRPPLPISSTLAH